MVGGFPRKFVPPSVEDMPPTVPAEEIEFDEDGRRRITKPLVPASRPQWKLPPPPPPPRRLPAPPSGGLFPSNLRPTRPVKPRTPHEHLLGPQPAVNPDDIPY